MKLLPLLAALLLLSGTASLGCPVEFTLTKPVAYETFQRLPTNEGSIYFAGAGPGGNYEARFLGGAWVRVARNVLPGDWTGELRCPIYGQGTLEVRPVGQPENTIIVENVTIGDIYVTAGQSNCTGAGDTLHTADHPVWTATMLSSEGVWQPLADPMGGVKGSVWPLVATQLMSAQNVPVAIIPCAWGGTSMAQWGDPNSAQFQGLLARGRRKGGVKEVVYWQGEKDAGIGTSTDAYVASFNQFRLNVVQQVRAFPRLARLHTGSFVAPEQQAAIRAAHIKGQAMHYVLTGPDLVELTCDGGFHLVQDWKLQRAADLWAQAILAP